MKITADNITDDQIKAVHERWPNRISSEVACDAMRLPYYDRRLDKAVMPDDERIRLAREICSAAFATSVDLCSARKHDHHVAETCLGLCCTACGGPVDAGGECRC